MRKRLTRKSSKRPVNKPSSRPAKQTARSKTLDVLTLKPHPFADFLPLMNEADYAATKADVHRQQEVQRAGDRVRRHAARRPQPPARSRGRPASRWAWSPSSAARRTPSASSTRRRSAATWTTARRRARRSISSRTSRPKPRPGWRKVWNRVPQLAAPNLSAASDYPIIVGDALKEMPKLPRRKFRLVFVDPRYNLGFKYDADPTHDQLPPASTSRGAPRG
jgi:hypothetical protein